MLTRFRPHGLIGPNSDELVAAGIIGIPERPTMQATGPVVLCRAGRWVFVSHDAGLILGQLPAVRFVGPGDAARHSGLCVSQQRTMAVDVRHSNRVRHGRIPQQEPDQRLPARTQPR